MRSGSGVHCHIAIGRRTYRGAGVWEHVSIECKSRFRTGEGVLAMAITMAIAMAMA